MNRLGAVRLVPDTGGKRLMDNMAQPSTGGERGQEIESETDKKREKREETEETEKC